MSGTIRQAGDSGLLLEFDAVVDPAVNARAIAAARALHAAAIPGVRDVVPTFRSVAVHFDPLRTDADALHDAVRRAAAAPVDAVKGRRIEVPVEYGGEAGPDLDAVAESCGLTRDDVVARHRDRDYRVFMLGFLPGFPYLGIVDERIAVARRPTPRVHVPAGSVGIAGRQTGIYPIDSPGGWQIIGRTSMRLFDADRTPAALMAPGDEVRFVVRRDASGAAPLQSNAARSTLREGGIRRVTVLRPGLFTTVQDRGRWGHQSTGVPVCGAMDAFAHRLANLLVGNPPDAATLEATVVGPELRLEQAATVAVAGADLEPSVDGAPLPRDTAVRCASGGVLRFGARRNGARAYIAFDGGIDTAPVLGSRSSHVPSRMGGIDGRALRGGDVLPLGAGTAPASRVPARLRATRGGLEQNTLGGARVRFIPGPQEHWFTDEAIDALSRTRFTIAPQSDRTGYRLHGGRAIARASDDLMISDATFPGAIQVPSSGDPILLMADRQTTGGYPQIGIVIAADLSRAAQLAPGDWVEFEPCSRAQAMAALLEQESRLLAIA